MTRSLDPYLLRYQYWPVVDPQLLALPKRARFNKLRTAIEALCDGRRYSDVSREYEISRSGLHYLLKRCLETHPDGRVWGYRALIHGVSMNGYVRSTPPDKNRVHDGYGLVGCFELLLRRHSKLGETIRKEIKGVGKLAIREGGLNIAALHRKLIEQLRREGLGPDDYPFNTRNLGYVSLVGYINRCVDEGDDTAARHIFGKSAQDGLQAGTGKKGVLRALHPLEIVCYDEQKLPFVGTLALEIDGVEHDVALSRGYLCLLVDTVSLAILGYAIAGAERFQASQLLEAVEMFMVPWRPRELTISGLKYQQGGGQPSGVLPACRGQMFSILSVDNHLTHLANSVVGHLRQRLGISIRFGPIRRWISRYVVEGVFAELQKRNFRRLPSTTGSGPDDPAVTNPNKKAVDLRIRMADLLQIVDVVIANHNARVFPSLMARTPLEVLATYLGDQSRFSILPRVTEDLMNDPQIVVERVTVTVRGSRARGRHPYVQLDYGKYTNDYLNQAWNMVGEKLTAVIPRDCRTIRVFRQDGSEFGSLCVMGNWSRSAHTREMRKIIRSLQRQRVLSQEMDDPVATYMEHLKKEAARRTQGKKNKYKTNRPASTLANIQHDIRQAPVAPATEPALEAPAGGAAIARSRGRRSEWSAP